MCVYVYFPHTVYYKFYFYYRTVTQIIHDDRYTSDIKKKSINNENINYIIDNLYFRHSVIMDKLDIK